MILCDGTPTNRKYPDEDRQNENINSKLSESHLLCVRRWRLLMKKRTQIKSKSVILMLSVSSDVHLSILFSILSSFSLRMGHELHFD